MITFGNVKNVLTDLEYTYNYDEESGNAVVVTYETPEDEVKSLVPELGSALEDVPGVVLLKAVVHPGEAGIASVRLEYGKPKTEEEETDEDKDSEGSDGGSGSGDSGSGGGSGSDESTGTVIEQSFEGGVCDEPLLTHPKLSSGISDAQLEYLKAVMDGARSWELVTVLDKNGKPKLDKDGQPIQKPLGKLVSRKGNAGTILGLILKGIQSYRTPCGTYRIVREANTSAVSLAGVAQIATPPGAPVVKGANWMLVSRNCSRTAKSVTSGKEKWRIEEVYELSGPGGWNTTLYS